MLNISCINFPIQSLCYRYVMVFQYTSLLLHGVSFSHLLVLIFFFLFSLLLLMAPNMGFGGSFVREGELIPILPVHLMWPAASALVFCIDFNLTDGPLGDNICECLGRLSCCWLWRHEDGQEVWRASVVVFGVDVLQKCPRLLLGLGWGQQTLIRSALLQETWKHEENWGWGRGVAHSHPVRKSLAMAHLATIMVCQKQNPGASWWFSADSGSWSGRRLTLKLFGIWKSEKISADYLLKGVMLMEKKLRAETFFQSWMSEVFEI